LAKQPPTQAASAIPSYTRRRIAPTAARAPAPEIGCTSTSMEPVMQAAITDWGEAMMTSLAAALALFLSAIPKIIGFAIILVVGWFIASLIERGLAAILRRVRFNEFANRSGLGAFVEKMNVGTDPAGMIGLTVKWFVRLIAMVVAFDALGLPAVSEVLRSFLMWMPNVVVALVVLIIGGLAARALSNLVRGSAAEAGLTNANMLAKLATVMVWSFAIVVAVNQLGIATTLVNTLFMAFVGALALGAGLAFGLGGRETAAQIVRNMYESAQENKQRILRAGENIQNRAAENAGSFSEGGNASFRPANKRHGGEGG
jgi:hypothetical protein